MHFVLSTVGTSILTNLIDRGNPTEGTWFGTLRDSANLKQDELGSETKKVINTLSDRALEKLLENDIGINRKISAELNGIYGIYRGELPENCDDCHYLICTDTAQGQQTGELIKDFLESRKITVSVVTPSQLSTKNTDVFAAGTKELIRWLEDTVSWQRDSGSGNEVIFNLVGGFKGLQGYMQTFGAFYADEIVYIFEGSTELIRIPRLPIQIDTTMIENHLMEFALMAVGKLYPREKLAGIPETMLELVDENGKTEAGLSAWGELLWHRTKSDLLSEELLELPRLVYEGSFINNCQNLNSQQQIDLQETLAKIAVVLEDTDGNITELNKKVSGLNFEQLTNYDGICTFRITQGVRVSCEITNNGLNLRRYGQHDDVYKNP